MNKKSFLTSVAVLAATLATLLISNSLIAGELQRFTSNDFGFTFEYPAEWEIRSPTFPSAKSVVGPKGGGIAECAVTIKLLPDTNSLSQADIDQFLLQKPVAAEYEESLGLQYNNVHVVSVGNTLLSTRPAQVARLLFSAGTQNGQVFSEGINLTTMTPGRVLGLTCGGLGSSSREAEKNFNQWSHLQNYLMASRVR